MRKLKRLLYPLLIHFSFLEIGLLCSSMQTTLFTRSNSTKRYLRTLYFIQEDNIVLINLNEQNAQTRHGKIMSSNTANGLYVELGKVSIFDFLICITPTQDWTKEEKKCTKKFRNSWETHKLSQSHNPYCENRCLGN